jgi:hypothetical protein
LFSLAACRGRRERSHGHGHPATAASGERKQQEGRADHTTDQATQDVPSDGARSGSPEADQDGRLASKT